MKAYIVWMNTEYELAEEAAIAINGHTISALQERKNRRGGRQGIPGHPRLFAGCAGYA